MDRIIQVAARGSRSGLTIMPNDWSAIVTQIGDGGMLSEPNRCQA
jgi:hypothetical protein